MEIPKDQPNQLNIEISEEISEGVYANLAMITTAAPATKAVPATSR